MRTDQTVQGPSVTAPAHHAPRGELSTAKTALWFWAAEVSAEVPRDHHAPVADDEEGGGPAPRG